MKKYTYFDKLITDYKARKHRESEEEEAIQLQHYFHRLITTITDMSVPLDKALQKEEVCIIRVYLREDRHAVEWFEVTLKKQQLYIQYANHNRSMDIDIRKKVKLNNKGLFQIYRAYMSYFPISVNNYCSKIEIAIREILNTQ